MENIRNEMARYSVVNQAGYNDYIDYDNKNKYEALGMCYVPMQKWEQVYDEDTAYSAGTLFPSLNKPFLGGGK